MFRERLRLVVWCGAGDGEEGPRGLLRALSRQAAGILRPTGAIPHQPLAPLRDETQFGPVSSDESASISEVGVWLGDHGIDWVITRDAGRDLNDFGVLERLLGDGRVDRKQPFFDSARA